MSSSPQRVSDIRTAQQLGALILLPLGVIYVALDVGFVSPTRHFGGHYCDHSRFDVLLLTEQGRVPQGGDPHE